MVEATRAGDRHNPRLPCHHPSERDLRWGCTLYLGKLPQEGDGRELKVRAEGPLAFNATPLILKTALAGLGLAYLPEDMVQDHIAAGRLVRVLADWSPLMTGYHLCYPNRQPSPAFALLVEALRYRAIATVGSPSFL